MALAVTVAIVLRPHRGESIIRADRGRLFVAMAIGAVALMLTFFGYSVAGLFFAVPAALLAMGSFLLLGSSLRPRGSVRRGVTLGAATYMAVGVAVTVIVFHVPFAEHLSEPGEFVLRVILWPALIVTKLAGDIG